MVESLLTDNASMFRNFVAHCPERVLPGRIMKELVEMTGLLAVQRCCNRNYRQFYRDFVQGEVLETDARTAEMAKLTENSYRDTNIAFANELSILFDKLI